MNNTNRGSSRGGLLPVPPGGPVHTRTTTRNLANNPNNQNNHPGNNNHHNRNNNDNNHNGNNNHNNAERQDIALPPPPPNAMAVPAALWAPSPRSELRAAPPADERGGYHARHGQDQDHEHEHEHDHDMELAGPHGNDFPAMMMVDPAEAAANVSAGGGSNNGTSSSSSGGFAFEEAKTNPDVPFEQLSLATQGRCLPHILDLLASQTCLPKPLHGLIAKYTMWHHDELHVGSILDCRDFLNDWYNASVLQVKGSSIMIHYIGWSRKWDEWLDRRCENDLERMSPAYHRTVRWGQDISVGDIVHIKTPYRDSREARVLQIIGGPEVIQRRIQFAKLLYATMRLSLLPPASTLARFGTTRRRRDVARNRTHSFSVASSSSSASSQGSMNTAEDESWLDGASDLSSPRRRHVRSSSMMMLDSPTSPQHRVQRSDLQAAYLSANPDHRECMEFLREALQHPETSTMVQQLLAQGLSAPSASNGDAQGAGDSGGQAHPQQREIWYRQRQMAELLVAGDERMAYPLWMPICELPCACYDNPERASVICLQNLTGHKHVNRFCAGGEIAIWKSSTSPDQALEREQRDPGHEPPIQPDL